MGLAERRAVQTVKETDFKNFEAGVKALCGFDLKLDFDWAALEGNKECVWICENKKFNGFMFEKITEALTSICVDAMGKTALQEKVKEIKMNPVAGELEFSAGVLTVNNDLTGSGAWGADQIKAKLEKEL
ncbi:hypothetical protein BH10BDE1_BH10BDE1_34880 [soil metagenome]